jgi:5,10-methylenetetrahydromethanopterin reductase
VGEVSGIESVATGVWFPGGQSPQEMARLSALAERASVDSVWVAEGQLGRDAFICLAAIACSTESVALGTGIVNPYARHPAQLAASFATLDELSGGRVVCGVGIGARDQLARLGYDVARPLRAARETLEMLRDLIVRRTVTYHGEKFRADSVRLGFRPARERIPLYLAAAGPKMCALAGELADGIYLPYGTPEFLRGAIENSSERRPPQKHFDVACQALLSVDDDPEVAKARVRPGIGFILTEPNAEGVLRANGLDPAKAQRIRDALSTRGVRAMAAEVDDEILQHLTITGDRAGCLAKLRAVTDAGVTHVTVSLLDANPDPVLELLATMGKQAAGT